MLLAEFSYGNDYDMWVSCGAQNGKVWIGAVIGGAPGWSSVPATDYVGTGKARDVCFCPAHPPYRYTDTWYKAPNNNNMGASYGISQWFLANAPSRRSLANGASFVRPDSFSDPAKVPWFADTSFVGANWGAGPLPQSSYWHPTSWANVNWAVGLLLRHSEKANIAFPDGHAEAYGLDRARREMGITKMILADYSQLNL